MSSIYANFGAFRTPKPSEYEQVMRSGMVVLDANVLLSLYRYNDRARQDLTRPHGLRTRALSPLPHAFHAAVRGSGTVAEPADEYRLALGWPRGGRA